MIKRTLLLLTFVVAHICSNAQVFPVYFAAAVQEKDKDILYFDWRPDYKSYDRAIITDQKGAMVAELSYPLNKLDITQLKGHEVLFVTAVDSEGLKSEAVEVKLREDFNHLLVETPAERILIKKQRGKSAGFVGTESGKEFIAKGVDYCSIRLAGHDSFEPDIIATEAHVGRIRQANRNPAVSAFHQPNLGELVQIYHPHRTEIMMRILKSHGYNLVRVFVKPGERGSQITKAWGLSGPPETEGISAAYMDNFVNFLSCARRYGIYVMPCFTENEMPDNDYFKELSKGASRQGIFFSEDGIKAKQHYMELFLQYIKDKDPKLINSMLALTMQNEFAFHSYEAPFKQLSGSYTFIDGSIYDMADDDERRALANVAIQNYYAKMKETVEAIAPGLPIGEGTFSMGAVGKTFDNSKGIRTIEGNKDRRFPMTAVELLNTDIDFLDFHVYRWGAEGTGKDVFLHFAENMKLTTNEGQKLMKSKPILMGEFGSFKEDEATLDEAIVFVKELDEAALEFGFKGSCYWTMRCFEQNRLWNLMWEDGKMLKAFNK
jgi:hypothetical protein